MTDVVQKRAMKEFDDNVALAFPKLNHNSQQFIDLRLTFLAGMLVGSSLTKEVTLETTADAWNSIATLAQFLNQARL